MPTTPGVLSALGGLIADTQERFRQDHLLRPQRRDPATAGRRPRGARTGGPALDDRTDRQSTSRAAIRISADMRYRGQSFEIDTPLDPAALAQGDIGAVCAAFHHEHARLYGHSDAAAELQVIALRLVITAPTPKPQLRLLGAERHPAGAGQDRQRLAGWRAARSCAVPARRPQGGPDLSGAGHRRAGRLRRPASCPAFRHESTGTAT